MMIFILDGRVSLEDAIFQPLTCRGCAVVNRKNISIYTKFKTLTPVGLLLEKCLMAKVRVDKSITNLTIKLLN